MAAPLGPRLLYLGGAQQARPDARVREEWWRPGLPHCGREYRAEAQGQIRSQSGVTKDLATKQLARLAARETAKKATKAAAPAVVKPKPAAPPTKTPPETPDQLRGRVRASLL